MLTPYALTCEHLDNPIGLDVTRPRLSWKSRASRRGARQTAYQIVATADSPDGATLWDTGKVASDASLLIPYSGLELKPGQRCFWRVRVWDENDAPSGWSDAAFWEMGLMDSPWQAQWIAPDWPEDNDQPQPAAMLRGAFDVSGGVKSARAYVTSLGLYELRMNGARVGEALLTPGWTSYDRRLLYQTYDITPLVREGTNVVGALLGDGWYRGYMGWEGKRNVYGDALALIVEVRVVYEDGRVETFGTDATWRAHKSPILMSDIYMGETYDARLEQPGWDQPGFDDAAWRAARVVEPPSATLEGQAGPFVVRHERLRPARVFTSPKGETIVDFGQNMVGWVKVRARGEAGTAIVLRHAEVLDQEGNFYDDNLRAARQTTRYILKGDESGEVFEPRFTFHGFRYVAVEGFPGRPTADNFTGVVLHSDAPQTGSFECSNPLINQLQRNIVWSQKGNFVDVPTDCPQRDERMGWTGDAQVFIRTAAFNMQVAPFFAKWLKDLRLDQLPDGNVPFVIPDVLSKIPPQVLPNPVGSAAWGDAAVICPWTLYLCYGDKRILEEQFDSMTAWVDYLRSLADDDLICRRGFHFGDWFDYRGEWDRVPAPVTNVELVATAFLAHSARLVSQAAQVIGRDEEARTYAELAQAVREAFVGEFVTARGRVGSGTQTSYALALEFELLPREARAEAARRLAEEVKKAGYHLTTGFVGTPYLCHVLSRYGHLDVAYALLNQDTYPSWLYPVKNGATTIWERWDGIKPDGSYQGADCNSFNHYAYGAVGEWLYRVVAGLEIDPDEPAYKRTLFQPQPGGGLTWAKATLDSPYGELVSSWEIKDGELRLRVQVPANARATVRLPADSLEDVSESGRPLEDADGVTSAAVEDGDAVIEIGSGEYAFAAPWKG